jgi:LPS sulfotransferase NodH
MYTHHKVDHEFADAAPTRVSYMVCSVPRCGSSLLCELLCNSGVAGAPTEFFDPRTTDAFRKRWGVESDSQYIPELLRRKTSPNGVFGMKVHWDQLWQINDADPAAVFPNLHFVHMGREDLLRQAVSWVRAVQTNQWASSHAALAQPAFDAEEITRYLDRIREHYAAWEQYFEARSIDPARVVYERLVEEPEQTLHSVLSYIGVAPPAAPAREPLELERQADALTDEWVARYAAYM